MYYRKKVVYVPVRAKKKSRKPMKKKMSYKKFRYGRGKKKW